MVSTRILAFVISLVIGIVFAFLLFGNGCFGQQPEPTIEFSVIEDEGENVVGGPISDAFERRMAKQQQDALDKQEQAFAGFFDRFREEQSKREIEQQRDRERRRKEELAEQERQREEDKKEREAFAKRFTPFLNFFERINAAAGEGTDAIWNLGKLALLGLVVGVVVLKAAELLLTLTFKMVGSMFGKVWASFSDALSNIVGA